MCLDTAQAFEADIQTQFTLHSWEFRREVILALLLGKKFERSNVYICAVRARIGCRATVSVLHGD